MLETPCATLANRTQGTHRSRRPNGPGIMRPKPHPGAVRLDVLDIPTVRFLQRTAGNASVAGLLASVGATRYPTVQRLPEDAFGLARTYSRKVYGSFDQLNADKYTFSAGEWRSIVDAYNRGSTGGVRLRYVYDEQAKARESGGPPPVTGLAGSEGESLADIQRELQKHPTYLALVKDLEARVGASRSAEFYRGAHIILRDEGEMYQHLVRTYGDLMKPRYTTKSQTSHYTAGAGYDVSLEESTPQQGIDLPSPLTGHILFGLVPPMTGKKEDPNTGHTFIQTEGSGFQTLYTKYVGHASGFFVNFLWGLQTGMIGTSVASEKTGKALVEESSPSTTPKTGGKSFLDYLGLW